MSASTQPGGQSAGSPGWTNCPLCGGAAQYYDGHGDCKACGFLWISATGATMTSYQSLTMLAHKNGTLKPPSYEHVRNVRRN